MKSILNAELASHADSKLELWSGILTNNFSTSLIVVTVHALYSQLPHHGFISMNKSTLNFIASATTVPTLKWFTTIYLISL